MLNREGRLPTATLGPKKLEGHFKNDCVTRFEILERARELFDIIRKMRPACAGMISDVVLKRGI